MNPMKTVVKVPLKKDIQVLVQEGHQFEKGEVIAKGSNTQENLAINLAQILKVKPTEIHKFLKKRPSDKIRQGEILAEKRSFLTIINVKSPISGEISEVNLKSGTVLLKTETDSLNEKITLPVDGKIKNIGKEAIEIEVKGSKIAASSGRGSETTGRLMHVAADKNSIFNIDAEVADKIVLVEKVTVETLAKLDTLGACGVISKETAKNYDFPSITVSDESFKALTREDKKMIWLRPRANEAIVIAD